MIRSAKKITLILSVVHFFAMTTYAQDRFAKADAIAINFSASVANVDELAQKLTADLESETDKARVFYMWLAKNVRYDCKKFHNPKRPEFQARSKSELEEMKMAYRTKQNQKTLSQKKGVCEDYSRLFKAMCDAVGMESVVITGNSRNFYKPFSSNQSRRHAWNAVKLEGEWKLLDATWGAGFTDPGVTRFTRKVSAGFFMVPASTFTQNHWPSEERWQLLDQPISKQEFALQPYINYGQEEFKITDYSPTVKTVTNGKEIWLAFEEVPKMINATSAKGKPVKFEKTEKNGKVVLTFTGNTSASVMVFGGNSPRGKLNCLAKYKM